MLKVRREGNFAPILEHPMKRKVIEKSSYVEVVAGGFKAVLTLECGHVVVKLLRHGQFIQEAEECDKCQTSPK